MFVFFDPELVSRIGRWEELKRWERRDVGQELRRLGLSYREIGAIIPVSKGTLSGWCSDMPLTPEQCAAALARSTHAEAMRRNGATKRKRNLERTAAIAGDAVEEARALAKHPLWVAGTMAYWAEEISVRTRWDSRTPTPT